MTYRVRFEAYALVQLHGLPSEALVARWAEPVLVAAHCWEEAALNL